MEWIGNNLTNKGQKMESKKKKGVRKEIFWMKTNCVLFIGSEWIQRGKRRGGKGVSDRRMGGGREEKGMGRICFNITLIVLGRRGAYGHMGQKYMKNIAVLFLIVREWGGKGRRWVTNHTDCNNIHFLIPKTVRRRSRWKTTLSEKQAGKVDRGGV